MIARRHSSVLTTLMTAFEVPITGIKDDLLCCGIVGSLEKDIDFLCVIKESGPYLPDAKRTARVLNAIRQGISNLSVAGLIVLPFTSFRTAVYLRQLCSKQLKSIPLHLLIYAGEKGLLLGEWPIITKSMFQSINNIIPADPIFLQHVEDLILPPLRNRLWYYVQLVIETQVLVNSYNKDMDILMAEVLHKIRYVVRYSIAEYFYEKGNLDLTKLYKYVPTIEHLTKFLNCPLAKRLSILQEQRPNDLTTKKANEICEIAMRLLEQIFEAIKKFEV